MAEKIIHYEQPTKISLYTFCKDRKRIAWLENSDISQVTCKKCLEKLQFNEFKDAK